MEINNICEQIKLSQEHNADAMENLLCKFSPILKKYAYYLRYDDAYYDMQVNFIELIYKINILDFLDKPEQYILSYIKKSMYHSYIKESKKSNIYRYTQTDSSGDRENLQIFIETLNPTHDEYTGLLLLDLKRVLSEKEFRVIYYHYFLEYSINEIAIMTNISSQSVNKTKKGALKKLRATVSLDYLNRK